MKLNKWMGSFGLCVCLLQPLTGVCADHTVGPHGRFGSIEEGIAAALADVGESRVLVEAGTYPFAASYVRGLPENPVRVGQNLIDISCDPNRGGRLLSLEVLGGYDATFLDSERSNDPNLTRLTIAYRDGYSVRNPAPEEIAAPKTIVLDRSACRQPMLLVMEGFRIAIEAGAASEERYAPFAVYAKGASINLSNNVFEGAPDTRASSVFSVTADALSGDPAVVVLQQNTIRNFSYKTPEQRPQGSAECLAANALDCYNHAPVEIKALGGMAELFLLQNEISSNRVLDANTSMCAGMQAKALRQGRLNAINNRIMRNTCAPAPGLPAPRLFQVQLQGYGFIVDRNRIDGAGGDALLLDTRSPMDYKMSARKSLVRNNLFLNSGIDAIGVYAFIDTLPTSVEIVNNTVANNGRERTGAGLFIREYERRLSLTVANNLFWNNPIDILEVDARTPSRPHQVFADNGFSDGANPAFTSETKGNYRIDCSLSPYIDRGTEVNYGRSDFSGQRRAMGSAVDYGAYECPDQ